MVKIEEWVSCRTDWKRRNTGKSEAVKLPNAAAVGDIGPGSREGESTGGMEKIRQFVYSAVMKQKGQFRYTLIYKLAYMICIYIFLSLLYLSSSGCHSFLVF